jgi:hypothetical protein
MTEKWNLFTCNNCGKQQHIPFDKDPSYTCYDCEMELEFGPTFEQIMDILQKEKYGLPTEEIADKIGEEYLYTERLLEYLQGKLLVQELFDDEVTNEDWWYIRT